MLKIILLLLFCSSTLAAEFEFISIDYPPLIYKNRKNIIVGSRVEAIKKAANRAGHKINFNILSVNRMIKEQNKSAVLFFTGLHAVGQFVPVHYCGAPVRHTKLNLYQYSKYGAPPISKLVELRGKRVILTTKLKRSVTDKLKKNGIKLVPPSYLGEVHTMFMKGRSNYIIDYDTRFKLMMKIQNFEDYHTFELSGIDVGLCASSTKPKFKKAVDELTKELIKEIQSSPLKKNKSWDQPL